MKVNITSSGNFSNLERWATKISTEDFTSVLKSAAQPGKSEFMRKTPVESGKSANAWDYKIEKTSTGAPCNLFTNLATATNRRCGLGVCSMAVARLKH